MTKLQKIEHFFHYSQSTLNLCFAYMLVGQVKNNEATQKYCIQGIYSAVMAYSC